MMVHECVSVRVLATHETKMLLMLPNNLLVPVSSSATVHTHNSTTTCNLVASACMHGGRGDHDSVSQ